MHIKMGPTGNTIKGDVMDVDRKHFERALKFYDPRLYTVWNPRKLHGWGCWEIRMKPKEKSIVDHCTWIDGQDVWVLDYAENNMVNHVLDCAFLNYDQIRKIKEMDTWNKDHWVHDLEYREEKQREAARDKAKKELAYNIRHNKKAFKEFLELVKAGKSPHRIILGEPV